MLLSLVTSLELLRLDYGSANLTGIPKYLLDRLQSIYRARKYDHVSPLLQELHWLFVPEHRTGVSLSVRHGSRVYGKRPSVGR